MISTQFELVKIQKLKKEASRSEIKALQNQINPHFLFNAL
ncbi:MAG: histidine kinase, partial [Dethiosulfatibacter sp.]|nr:histidine kinase [Dethiosulfatibacter sp.]